MSNLLQHVFSVVCLGLVCFWGFQIWREHAHVEKVERVPAGPNLSASLATKVLPGFVTVELTLKNTGSEAVTVDLQREKGAKFGVSKVLKVNADGRVEYGPEKELEVDGAVVPAAGQITRRAASAVSEPGLYLVLFRPPLAPGEPRETFRPTDAAVYVAVE